MNALCNSGLATPGEHRERGRQPASEEVPASWLPCRGGRPRVAIGDKELSVHCLLLLPLRGSLSAFSSQQQPSTGYHMTRDPWGTPRPCPSLSLGHIPWEKSQLLLSPRKPQKHCTPTFPRLLHVPPAGCPASPCPAFSPSFCCC